MPPLADCLSDIQDKINKNRSLSVIAAPAITLVAASKGQDAGKLLEAIRAGVTHFGENRVQEADTKWPPLMAAHPHLRLHLIGGLQTNKVKEAVSLFHVIETIDSEKLVDAVAKEVTRQEKHIDCFIQVNTGEEPQKSGVNPQDADAFISYAKQKINVVGLMCVPPVDALPAPHFAMLREIALRNGLTQLSMGMSEDYDTAVRMGATQVRVGRALFGNRHPVGDALASQHSIP